MNITEFRPIPTNRTSELPPRKNLHPLEVPSDPPHSAELARIVRESSEVLEAEARTAGQRAAEVAAANLRVYGFD